MLETSIWPRIRSLHIAAALVLYLCLILIPFQQTAAQSDIQPLDELQLAFWPEYDRSAMLVVYRFRLPENTALPAQVIFRIPTRVGEPSAVAYRDSTGQLLVADYVREVEGDWAAITIELPALSGQLEYYDTIRYDGEQRRFPFEWPGGVVSDSVSYEVQLPVNVEELAILPAAQEEIRGPDGLRYRYAALDPLDSTDQISIDIHYTKPDSLLSVDRSLPEISIEEPVAPAVQGPDLGVYLPWVLGAAGLLLIAGGAGWLFLINRSERRTGSKRPHLPSAKSKHSTAGTEIDASTTFCHQCGTQANASDRYCRHCGTKLRT